MDYHRMKATITPATSPRSTTTLSQTPTETEYYNESVPGNEVWSTPLGIPHQPHHRQTDTPSSSSSSASSHSSTTTRSSTITARIRHTRPHPDENGGHGRGHGRNGGHHRIVTDESNSNSNNLNNPSRNRGGAQQQQFPTHHESSTTGLSTYGSRDLTTFEDVATISSTTGRTEPAFTTQPPKYCIVGRPKQPEQKIREGSSKRV